MLKYCAVFMEKMDLDIGSLFYILMAIVAVIGGIARKRKKTTTEAPVAEEGSESSKEGFFGKLEKQFEGFADEAKNSMQNLKNDFIPGSAPVKEAEYAEVDERDYFEKMNDEYEAADKNDLKNNFAKYEGLWSPDDEQNDELMESEGISVTDALELSHLDEDQEISFEDMKMLKEFDARTAIIYSTIINRIEI